MWKNNIVYYFIIFFSLVFIVSSFGDYNLYKSHNLSFEVENVSKDNIRMKIQKVFIEEEITKAGFSSYNFNTNPDLANMVVIIEISNEGDLPIYIRNEKSFTIYVRNDESKPIIETGPVEDTFTSNRKSCDYSNDKIEGLIPLNEVIELPPNEVINLVTSFNVKYPDEFYWIIFESSSLYLETPAAVIVPFQLDGQVIDNQILVGM